MKTTVQGDKLSQARKEKKEDNKKEEKNKKKNLIILFIALDIHVTFLPCIQVLNGLRRGM